MEYFKHKTLSIYIWLMIAVWPLMYIFLSPVNNAIITFIAFMADFVVHVNKLRKMVYSEYKLIKGTQANSIGVHIWLLFVILSFQHGLYDKWINNNSTYTAHKATTINN